MNALQPKKDQSYNIAYKTTAVIAKPELQNPYNAHVNYVESDEDSDAAPTLSRSSLLTIVHEIKNPLNNIHLSNAFLKEELLNPDLQVYLNIISKSTKRINDLITALLSSEDQAKKSAISVEHLLTETLELSMDKLRLHNVQVDTSECVCSSVVKVNVERFKLALNNIVINAIEAMPKSAGVLKISTTATRARCYISITDNGAGIARRDLKKIFTSGFKRKTSGSGIGLSVTKQVFIDHEATVQIKSKPGSGTCFRVGILIS